MTLWQDAFQAYLDAQQTQDDTVSPERQLQTSLQHLAATNPQAKKCIIALLEKINKSTARQKKLEQNVQQLERRQELTEARLVILEAIYDALVAEFGEARVQASAKKISAKMNKNRLETLGNDQLDSSSSN